MSISRSAYYQRTIAFTVENTPDHLLIRFLFERYPAYILMVFFNMRVLKKPLNKEKVTHFMRSATC